MAFNSKTWYQLTNLYTGPQNAHDCTVKSTSGSNLGFSSTNASNDGQYWQFQESPGGNYRLRCHAYGASTYLTVYGPSNNSIPSLSTTFNNATDQWWNIKIVTEGAYTLSNVEAGPKSFLDVYAGSETLSMQPDGNHTGQQWNFGVVKSLDPVADAAFLSNATV